MTRTPQYYIQNSQGLTADDIRTHCPSVYATEPHESRSAKYGYVPTSEVIAGLREIGMVPTVAMQSRSRIEGKTAYTKHLLRFRRECDLGYNKPDVSEVVVENSHDGTTGYHLMQGVFRLICSNGMILWDEQKEVRIRHQGNIVQRVVDSTLELVQESEETMDTVEQMKQVTLSRPEQLLLAKESMYARFDEDLLNQGLIVYQPEDFLRRRRTFGDEGEDLWTIGNVIQENLIRGKVTHYVGREKKSTRPVTGIDQSVKINQMLWRLQEGMLRIKQQG